MTQQRMFQAKPVSCKNKVSSNNCRYSQLILCAQVQALKFWVQDCAHAHLQVRLTIQGGHGCTCEAAQGDLELHNVVFSNQAGLNRLQPLPAFIPLPSALLSGFFGSRYRQTAA